MMDDSDDYDYVVDDDDDDKWVKIRKRRVQWQGSVFKRVCLAA
jgi:hypothetical protein